MSIRVKIPGRARLQAIPLAAAASLALLAAGGAALDHPPSTSHLVPSEGPSFARVSLPTGVSLHYAEQGDPADPAVVLLHGWSDSWFSFSRILPLLPEGYRYLAIDQRGHGASDKPAAGYALDQMSADVIAFLDALDLERVILVGHSMGSFVAQRVARTSPGRVGALVLIGSVTNADAIMGIDEIDAWVDSLEDPMPPEEVREFQLSTMFGPVPAAFLDTVVSESLRLNAGVWRAVYQGFRNAGRFGPATPAAIPTLLMWGDREPLMPRSEQEALMALFPEATLTVYEETGHAPHWERPERVAANLGAFLARMHPVPRPSS